jgi:hypothetical protein
MELKKGSFCPFIKKDCIQMQCALFTCVRGIDPNTGKEIDDWGCAMGWLPVLLINSANESRKTTAATESFRNEMVNQGQQTQKVLLQAMEIERQTKKIFGDSLIIENTKE